MKSLRSWVSAMANSRTAKFAKQFMKKKHKLSKKGLAVKAALDAGDFGCSKSAVRKLVSAIIGEDLTEGSEKVSLPDFACLVVLANGKTHIVVDGHEVIDETASRKFTMSQNPAEIRPATSAESKAFLAKLSDETLERFFGKRYEGLKQLI